MTQSEPENDRATLAAIGVVAYALANLLHEGVGHGGACLLMGGHPRLLTSLHFDGDESGLSSGALRFLAAGGTLTNLAASAVAFLALRLGRRLPPHTRYFLWLLATINLLQGTGYLLFSGVGGIGDWAAVVRGWGPAGLWRVLLAVAGGVAYWFAVRFSLRQLGPFLGPTERARRALPLLVVPYIAGALLYCLSGLFNPEGPALILVSGAAASLGGTSGLAWGASLLRGGAIPASPEEPLPLPRHWDWIAVASALAAFFVSILGPGIRLL